MAIVNNKQNRISINIVYPIIKIEQSNQQYSSITYVGQPSEKLGKISRKKKIENIIQK